MSLTNYQRIVIEKIIEDMKVHGCPPTQARVATLAGVGHPWKMLKSLQEKGYMVQPYEGGPWVPLRDAEGRELRLVLQVVTAT